MKHTYAESVKGSLFKDKHCIFDYPLKERTGFKIGGSAEIFFTPYTEAELQEGLDLFKNLSVPVSIIGGATNLLIADTGIRGAVISLEHFNTVELVFETAADVFVRAGAGLLTDKLAHWAAENAVSGLESFGGLPGTLGGAAFMNARCYDTSVSEVLFSAKTVYYGKDGVIFEEYRPKPAEWGYKVSPFQKNAAGIRVLPERRLITELTFKLKRGNRAEITEKTREKIEDRIKKGHFKKPSAGSVFKNNRAFGAPCGKIIDEAGLRGLSLGGAQVAPWHGNFIVNNGEAEAEDVRKLIEKVQKIIGEKYGFLPEPEIIFAGFDEP